VTPNPCHVKPSLHFLTEFIKYIMGKWVVGTTILDFALQKKSEFGITSHLLNLSKIRGPFLGTKYYTYYQL
jgi:hypothetical protein